MALSASIALADIASRMALSARIALADMASRMALSASIALADMTSHMALSASIALASRYVPVRCVGCCGLAHWRAAGANLRYGHRMVA